MRRKRLKLISWKSDIQAKNLRKELEAKHKVIKEYEKLIHKLEQKNENLTKNHKNLRAELNIGKNENRKLVRNKSKESQYKNSHVQTQETASSEQQTADHEEDSNRN